MKMASLRPGVLLKLLEEMDANYEDSQSLENRKPALLQVRSIVPVTVEGDLWPNKGFYLKVSDYTHAMYVSLPQEMDDLILCNNLKLGQFIHVDKIEASPSIPILKGVTPIPGWHPCLGTPVDIFSGTNLATVFKGIDPESSKAKVNGRKKKNNRHCRSLSISRIHCHEYADFNCIDKECISEKKASSNVVRGLHKALSVPVEKQSDSDSPASSSSSKRRSWNGIRRKCFSIVPKSEIRPTNCSHSANASPNRYPHQVRFDENSNSKPTPPPEKGEGTKSTHKCFCTSHVLLPAKVCEEATWKQVDLKKRCLDIRIPWKNLPPNLVQLGKEVVRQRDAAMRAATGSLQEAAAAERLIKSLSTFSTFHKESKDDRHEPSVEKFLNLQENIADTKRIIRSLTTISPLGTPDFDFSKGNSIQETLKLAIERKKTASSWINALVASDLPPFSDFSKPISLNDNAKRAKKSCRGGHNNISKSAGDARKLAKLTEIPEIDKETVPFWTRGSTVNSASNLADLLQNECQVWFLDFLEKILDGSSGKTVSKADPDTDIAQIMCQIKGVNNLLDVIGSRDSESLIDECNGARSYQERGNNDGSKMEENVVETCGRVRNKIYGILLDHVERTATEHFATS